MAWRGHTRRREWVRLASSFYTLFAYASAIRRIDRRIRQPLRSRDTCGFFRHSLAIWRQVVWPRRPANPQRMPGASIASISLYVCHPRPVNAYRYATKQRLGLDAERSWVMLTEANRFVWPGPDLRMKEPSGGPESMAYGLLPRALFKEITGKFSDAVETRLAHVIRRTQ
jgi:hypothetical protein